MDKLKLLRQLHKLRLKLHKVAELRGSLTDPDVIAVSEKADRLIVTLQKIQKLESQAPIVDELNLKLSNAAYEKIE
ncbi:Spo0E family sporulation regulatory protein-aspartic acid phosphatase [Paenibacillus tarimensis]